MFISSFINNKKKNCCVIFITQQINLDIETNIINYVSENIIPEYLYVIFNNDFSHINKKEFDRFSNRTKIDFINFDSNGNFQFESTKRKKEENLIITLIKKEILKEIFLKHDCILKASSESYFVMPSGKHATHFVRIANLFKNSNEIGIFSLFLLPYFKNQVEYVYCDTPTIFSLIYSIILYKISFDKSYKIPEIKFYSSSSLNPIDFDKTKQSLYIVSTSINGSLPKKINNLGIDWSKIITLYSFDNDETVNYQTLYKDNKNELIDKNFYSLAKDEFEKKYPNKIFPVKFEDEQFIPTQPNVSKILLNKDDAPSFVNQFYERYKDKELIKCFSEINSLGNKRDVFFDISSILNDENYFTKKLNTQVINKLPSKNLIFIYIDNEFSKVLASYIIKKSTRKIKSFFIDDFEKDTSLNLKEKYNFFVISSCISNGKKISKCSMLLRNYGNSNINFVSGFVRFYDKNVYRIIKNNLTYGEYGFNTHNFYSIEEIYLPNEDSKSLSWEKELNLIEKVLNDEFNELGISVNTNLKEYLEKRKQSLSSNSLINNLYLPSIKYRNFKLNKNFAFFNDRNWEPKDIKQSQVYFTLLSVLHNYKLTNMVKQTLYERYILDPENFIRFNDSIIRATFLRCCSKEELNYDLDYKSSEKITNIIYGLVTDLTKGDNIIYEFLLAICINKLTINQNHLKELYKKLTSIYEYKEDYVFKFYLDYIEKYIIL